MPAGSRALGVRLFNAMLQTQELLTCYLGVRLGLYEALAGAAATCAELSERAGIAPRYAREWLEQQAVAGILEVEDPLAGPEERVFVLSPEHARVLLASGDPLSLVSLTTLPLGGVAAALPRLLEAFRTGDGVPDEAYGDDWREGHSGANRALFTHALPGWIGSALPGLHARLGGAPSVIADVGCGAGWAAIALATAYPLARVEGYDLDGAVLEQAARNAKEAGVADRVTFVAGDVTSASSGGYDLVCVFDALHEMSHPVPVLEACRAMRADGGTVLVLDARVAPRFTAPGDEVERFQYCTSVLHCLPAALHGEDAAGTGTVMRPATVRRHARAAGFGDARELPIADRFHRLYELTPPR